MGLLQQAYETYCFAENALAGVYEAGKAEPLAPVGHSITKANIEITLDEKGDFIRGETVSDDDAKTIFPVTEESSGRTSAPCPHPLCEQLGYLMPDDTEKYNLYVTQLQDWCNSGFSHPMLLPILTYVKRGSILSDLVNANVVKVDEKGKAKDTKSFIRWRVIGIGDESGPCWQNRSLMKAFIDYYVSLIKDRERGTCMISGTESSLAKQHAKGVVSFNGNAKLISSNDTSNYTYRGRFLLDAEALTIGYEASQKAHNALRWIVSNQGSSYGGRTFVCWVPRGKEIPKPTGVLRPKHMLNEKAAYETTDYKQNLRNVISGWKAEFSDDPCAVTAVFDAATPGRLALTYYSEIQAKDFLDRLGSWDETCCWPTRRFGIQAPSLYKLAQYAGGTLRSGEIKTDDNIYKQLLLRLLTCRLEKAQFPYDIEQMLVKKANTLALYEDNESSKWLRSDLLFVTCAAIKKFHFDHFKEEWDMALEPEKKDRSYQYGRLLAVLEKIERDTYDNSDSREPNAIRMQSVFAQRPQYASRIIIEQVKRAYYRQLSNGQQIYYERLIGEIMGQLSAYEEEANKPLGDTYLLGYYLQKNALYAKKEEN